VCVASRKLSSTTGRHHWQGPLPNEDVIVVTLMTMMTMMLMLLMIVMMIMMMMIGTIMMTMLTARMLVQGCSQGVLVRRCSRGAHKEVLVMK
jgi:hypothetical protein